MTSPDTTNPTKEDAVNEHQAPTTGQDPRDREVAARHRVQQAQEAREQARRSVGVRESEVRNAQADRGRSAEVGHAQAHALEEVAERRFREALRSYLPALQTVVGDAPDPPSAELVAAGVLAGFDADGIAAALHETIDATVDDPSTGVFTIATEAQVADVVAAKREDLDVARKRLEELDQEVAEAEASALEISIEPRR
jgi:hypothetical protein